jgi:Bacterial protein of unknown function (Gcw_chp)
MRRYLAFAAVPALVLALVTARPASAQVSVGADLGVYSAYVWRGLSLTNRPVLQPDLWLSYPVGGNASITVGGWSTIDIGKYDDPNDDISEGGGHAGPDLTEFDWYGELGTTVGSASLTLGVTGYVYPNDFGLTSTSNTIEIYGQIGLSNVLSPSLSAYYDVDKIKGLYLEGSISHDLAISPSFTLTLGALAGLSAGQGCEPDSNDNCTVVGNFFDNGLTHVDLSAATSFTAGSFSISPAFHFQISQDEFTKFNTPSKFDEGSKIWFGVSFSWASGGGDEAAAE